MLTDHRKSSVSPRFSSLHSRSCQVGKPWLCMTLPRFPSPNSNINLSLHAQEPGRSVVEWRTPGPGIGYLARHCWSSCSIGFLGRDGFYTAHCWCAVPLDTFSCSAAAQALYHLDARLVAFNSDGTVSYD